MWLIWRLWATLRPVTTIQVSPGAPTLDGGVGVVASYTLALAGAGVGGIAVVVGLALVALELRGRLRVRQPGSSRRTAVTPFRLPRAGLVVMLVGALLVAWSVRAGVQLAQPTFTAL